jgi:hypothetical protein
MKPAKPVALIAWGNLTDSPLTPLLRLSGRLGPVKSASFRVASRVANIIREGHPVKYYADLDKCHLILVSVPDVDIPRVITELATSEINWPGKAIVLYNTWLGSDEMQELSARGAAVGSISPIPGFEDSRYLVEGDRMAIRESRRLLEQCQRRILDIEGRLKPLYLAWLTCTGSLLFGLLLAAAESLRHAGVTSALSALMLEKQMGKTLRSYLKAGRQACPDFRELPKILRALAAADPELALYVEQSSGLAARLLEKAGKKPPKADSEPRPEGAVTQ